MHHHNQLSSMVIKLVSLPFFTCCCMQALFKLWLVELQQKEPRVKMKTSGQFGHTGLEGFSACEFPDYI
jgi:hypothetical protein